MSVASDHSVILRLQVGSSSDCRGSVRIGIESSDNAVLRRVLLSSAFFVWKSCLDIFSQRPSGRALIGRRDCLGLPRLFSVGEGQTRARASALQQYLFGFQIVGYFAWRSRFGQIRSGS